MLCLVAEHIHAGEHADTAKEQCNQEQRTLRDAPFVAINCAALNKTMLESELFGYENGAFTGARKGGKPGLFETAKGGTLFLDEISEMDYDLQAKLLRVLQEKKFRRIGGLQEIDIDNSAFERAKRRYSAFNETLSSHCRNSE